MGLFFAILSPALDSISNYIDKFLLEKHDIHPLAITIYTTILSIIVGVGVFVIVRPVYTDAWSVLLIIISGFLTAMYLMPYFKALSLDDASRVIPLAQLVPVFVLLLSFLFLGEKLTLVQYVGALCIISASFLLTMEKNTSGIFRLRPAFYYMVLATFLFAVSIVLYKFGVKEVSFWDTLPLESIGTALGAGTLLMYKNNYQIVKKQTQSLSLMVFYFISLTEILFLFARYSAYFALSLISASIMSILSGFQPLFVLVIGLILSLWFPHILKEVIDRKTIGLKIVASVLIFAGLYAIFM